MSLFDAMYDSYATALIDYAGDVVPVVYSDQDGHRSLQCIIQDRHIFDEVSEVSTVRVQVENLTIIVPRNLDPPEQPRIFYPHLDSKWEIDGKKYTVNRNEGDAIQVVSDTFVRVSLRRHGAVSVENVQASNLR